MLEMVEKKISNNFLILKAQSIVLYTYHKSIVFKSYHKGLPINPKPAMKTELWIAGWRNNCAL
jgi:hypothetical protein